MSNAQKNEIQNLIPIKKVDGLLADEEEGDKQSNVSPAPTQVKSQVPLLSEKQVKDAQVALFNEYKFNIESFDKEQGQKVMYDQPLQLLHLASSKWLCCNQEEAKFENQNYRLNLSDYTSEATLFKIVPSFKFQKEGDQIIYASEIVRIIRSIPLLGKPTYLHCSGEIIDMKKSHMPSSNPNLNKIQKREINASLEEATSWKLNLFSGIRIGGCGSLVWLHHSESCSTLAVNHEYKRQDMKLSVHQGNAAELSFDSYTGNAYSMWIVEADDYKLGGAFLYKTQYRLKHYSSGMYLAIVRILPKQEEIVEDKPYYGKKLVNIPKSQKAPAQFALQVIPDRNALFEFEPLKSVERDEVEGDFVYLKSVEHNKYIDIIGGSSGLKPTILNQKNEHAVFKLFAANESETLEVFYLDSCNKQLTKYLYYIQLEFNNHSNDVDLLKIKQKKLKTAYKCILSLEEFILQKIYNQSPQQKYGQISPVRQRLMREQHFIDILINILTQSVNKQDLEIWSNRRRLKQEQPAMTAQSSVKKLGISAKEKQEIAIAKVEVCSQIFILLGSACTNSPANQMYLFECLPQYQHFCKYLTNAVGFLKDIVKSNERILLSLSHNLRIEFDYQKEEEIQDDMSKKVKILINFYEKDTQEYETKIPFKVHDRIVAKPVNIVNYFFNLLWDDTAMNKEDYLLFLRSICRYQQQGISANQENLFKLYKKYTSRENIFKLDVEAGNVVIPQHLDKKQFQFFIEQLQFYSEVAFNRNYIWKNLLTQLFSQQFLFNNIWKQFQLIKENQLRPLWCKLGTQLYVDQQPNNPVSFPTFCRLYSRLDQDRIIQKQENSFNSDLLIGYLKEQKKRMHTCISNQQQLDILNDELIFNSAELTLTMLNLDIFPTAQFHKLIRYFLHLFIYDRKNLNYLRGAIESYKTVVVARRDKKTQVIGQFGNMFNPMNMLNLVKGQAKNEEEIPEEQEDQNLYDQTALFGNPIMRGFMTMSYKLENVISVHQSIVETEFKLKLCALLDHFLDRRQNFLISNIMVMFKKHKYNDEDLSDDEGDQSAKAGVKMFNNNYLTLIPTIARTGIPDIDEPPKVQEDFMQINLQISEPPKFTNYFKKYLVEQEEVLDLDQYLSLSYKDNSNENPIASVFPYLLSTFYLVKDSVLEERCLNVMMRIFNQRDELRMNLRKVQIIFDEEKTEVFEFVEKNIVQLKQITESSEIWLSQFRSDDVEEIHICTNIIEQLTLSMRKRATSEMDSIVDEKRQSIMNFLKVHEILVAFVKNGMSHLVDVLTDLRYLESMKSTLFKLFETAVKYLITFSENNRTNQQALFIDIETFLQYLQYDVGQSRLLIEIFKDNAKLLNNEAASLVDTVIGMIDKEGRQSKYIDILSNLIKLEDNYILENQMLVLSKLIPLKHLTDLELRILYAEGSKPKHIQFYLDDQYIQPEQNLLTQLKGVDWKDTYRDEPFIYQAAIVDLLLQTCLISKIGRKYNPEDETFGRDNFNISVFKLKKTLRASYILELLRQPDSMVVVQLNTVKLTKLFTLKVAENEDKFDRSVGYSVFKPILAEYLLLVHITSEKGNLQDCQMAQLGREFTLMIEFETKKLKAVIQGVQHNGYAEYVVDYILPILIQYHERLLTPTSIEVKKAIQSFSDVFAQALSIELYKHIVRRVQLQIIAKFKSIYYHEDYELIFNKASHQSLMHLMEQPDEFDNEDVLEPVDEQLVQKPSKSQQKSNNLLNMGFGMSSMLGLKKTKVTRDTMTIAQSEVQWNVFSQQMYTSPFIMEAIELEKQALADAIVNVDKLITAKCDIKPSIDSILKKLINFLQTAILQPKNKGTIIILLKMMCKIIEKDPKQQEDYQILFDDLGATRMVLNVICDYAKLLSTEMLYNMLTFINVLLKNGNNKVQKTVYGFVTTQQKSEIIFQTFAKYIRAAANQSRDENEDKDEAALKNSIVNSILKFMQNCAEGHYLDLQNYIRYQHNSRASIDMINLVADLFKNQEKTTRTFSNLMRCMDTLNELVQGPCLENQVAVADSKFFDVVQELFPLRKVNANAKNAVTMRSRQGSRRKSAKSIIGDQPLSNGMIAQLQNKILVLVLSLMESREIRGKNSMIRRIMRSLPINVLEKHISKVYKKWIAKYGDNNYIMDAFTHLQLDAEVQLKEDPLNKDCETIIQNGFYLMFLTCYYIESGEELDSPFISFNKQYLKNQNKLNSLFDPNSTLGQLFNLVQELIEQSVLMSERMIRASKMQSQEEEQQEKLKQKQEDRKRRMKKAFMFFRNHTAHIEVIRDEQIELVFFPLLPFSTLNKEEKQLFQQTVDRSSAKAKVQDLMEKSGEFIEMMIHEEEMKRVYKKYRIIGFFAQYVQLWKDLAFYLTLVLNIFILGSFSHSEDTDPLKDYQLFRNSEYQESDTLQIFFILGLIMTICSLFVVVFVLAKIAPLIVKKALKRKPIFEQDVGFIQLLINGLAKILFVLFYCLADFQLLYYLGYGTMAVLGIVIHPFFFCFHLTVILIRYPTLRNVVRSVTEPRQSLILTLLLIIILTYIYTLIAYFSLQDDYQENCQQVLFCFLQIFDMNFKVPGGIGGQMTQDNPSPIYQAGRYLFDQTNNLLLVIIMISIASGIIIDTFGQLREEENQMQSDIKDKCFICGLENITFERSSEGSSGGFQGHIRLNHYMWNYLYYIGYLDWKDPQDFSGIESYITAKMGADDLSWIPFNKARELQRDDDQEEKQVKKIEGIAGNSNNTLENSKLILQQLRQFKERKPERLQSMSHTHTHTHHTHTHTHTHTHQLTQQQQ